MLQLNCMWHCIVYGVYHSTTSANFHKEKDARHRTCNTHVIRERICICVSVNCWAATIEDDDDDDNDNDNDDDDNDYDDDD